MGQPASGWGLDGKYRTSRYNPVQHYIERTEAVCTLANGQLYRHLAKDLSQSAHRLCFSTDLRACLPMIVLWFSKPISWNVDFFPHGATAPFGPGPPFHPGFTITLRRTTIGLTPLDWWSARRRDLYLTTHNTHKIQTSILSVGFEPAIPASERPLTHNLRLRSHWDQLGT